MEKETKEKEVRIVYKCVVYIKGEDYDDVSRKWLDLDIEPKGDGVTDFEFDGMEAEDCDTFEDVTNEIS